MKKNQLTNISFGSVAFHQMWSYFIQVALATSKFRWLLRILLDLLWVLKLTRDGQVFPDWRQQQKNLHEPEPKSSRVNERVQQAPV